MREYGAWGTIKHLISTTLDTETGTETVDEETHEVKMVLLPVSMITAYAQQMRSSSDYGNLYAQGNSIVAVALPMEFEVSQDDVVEINNFKFRVVDLNHLHHENVLELIVKS
jgi:hypothetical protein